MSGSDSARAAAARSQSLTGQQACKQTARCPFAGGPLPRRRVRTGRLGAHWRLVLVLKGGYSDGQVVFDAPHALQRAMGVRTRRSASPGDRRSEF